MSLPHSSEISASYICQPRSALSALQSFLLSRIGAEHHLITAGRMCLCIMLFACACMYDVP
jgi:hypothetical protein